MIEHLFAVALAALQQQKRNRSRIPTHASMIHGWSRPALRVSAQAGRRSRRFCSLSGRARVRRFWSSNAARLGQIPGWRRFSIRFVPKRLGQSSELGSLGVVDAGAGTVAISEPKDCHGALLVSERSLSGKGRRQGRRARNRLTIHGNERRLVTPRVAIACGR